jgi:hypothetical protein
MRAVAVIGVALIAACDIPTELPKWNPAFAVPLTGTSIAVAQLVPISLESAPDSSTFVMSPASASFPYALSTVCPACAASDGQIAPTPAFQYAAGYAIPFPVTVDSAGVVNGAINFRLTNGWNFDPLRPAPGRTGFMSLELIGHDGNVRGFSFFSGQDRSFAPGSTINGTLTFAGAATQTPILQLRFNSPAGNPVRMDAASSLTLTVVSGRLVATDATVKVSLRQVTSLPMQLNLTGIDDFVIRRVRGGKLVLRIANGFHVTGRMTLNIAGGINPVSQTFDIPADDSTVEVELSEADLESILGRAVVASVQGNVSTSGSVKLTPASTFTVEPLLVLELGPGS